MMIVMKDWLNSTIHTRYLAGSLVATICESVPHIIRKKKDFLMQVFIQCNLLFGCPFSMNLSHPDIIFSVYSHKITSAYLARNNISSILNEYVDLYY